MLRHKPVRRSISLLLLLRLVLPLGVFLLIPASAHAGTFTAADCTRDAVDKWINNFGGGGHTAVDGDVIQIPAGSCSWTAGITVPSGIGITITGTGTGNSGAATSVPSASCASGGTTITLNAATGFIATPQFGNALMRLSCMTLAYGSGGSTTIGFAIEGTCTVSGCPNLRVDNITFANWAGHQSGGGLSYGVNAVGDMFGVLDHNSLIGVDLTYLQLVEFQHASYLGVGSYGDNSWAQTENYGSANFLFIENNTFSWSGCCENEGDAGGGIPKRGGGRVVVRFNTFLQSDSNNFAMGWHGTESNGRGRGARAFEFYGNVWNCNEVCGQVAGGRSATGLVWGNTLAVLNNPAVAALNSFFTFTTYRASLAFTPWGACDGSSVYDANDGVTYYSGTVLSGGGTLSIRVSGSPGWMPDQFIPSGAPYSLHDSQAGNVNGTEILSNSSDMLTLLDSFNSSFRPANGDTIQVLRATSCIDQAGGRGAGQLYNSVDPATPLSASAEVVSPSYLWSNNFTGRTTFQGGATFGVTSYTARVIRNRDFYSEDTNQGIQTTNASPFNGGSTGSGAAVGIGHGTRANRPTNCTTGVGYFSTDQGSWNTSGNGFGNGVLDKCTSMDTWTSAFYTPYAYPHPLDSAASCTPDHLTFTAQPSNANTGASLGTVTVVVQDSGGSTCGSDTSAITIANKGGTCTGMTLGGTASGSNTFTTSNLTENAAGSCTLHATDGALTAADSNSFTISNGASNGGASRLRLR